MLAYVNLLHSNFYVCQELEDVAANKQQEEHGCCIQVDLYLLDTDRLGYSTHEEEVEKKVLATITIVILLLLTL